VRHHWTRAAEEDHLVGAVLRSLGLLERRSVDAGRLEVARGQRRVVEAGAEQLAATAGRVSKSSTSFSCQREGTGLRIAIVVAARPQWSFARIRARMRRRGWRPPLPAMAPASFRRSVPCRRRFRNGSLELAPENVSQLHHLVSGRRPTVR
jgi:hypothetical protein